MQSITDASSENGWLRRIWFKNFLSLVPYTFITPKGYRIECRRRYEIRMCEKIFACDQYPLDRLGIPIETVLDVGANIGVFSMFCADRFSATVKKIIAVEPFRKNFERISETVQRNRLDQLVRPLNLAAGNERGQGSLLLADSHYSNSLLPSKVKSPKAAQPVEVTTLNDLMREKELKRVDLLKIDVEGVELKVLEAAADVLAVTGALVIEAHKNFCTFGQLRKLLGRYSLAPLEGTNAADDSFGDFCFVRRNA